MVDPLSVTSLIIDIGTLISNIISYAKAVRDARSDTQRLIEELFAVKGILEHLSAQVEPQDLRASPLNPEPLALFNPELLESTLSTTHEFIQSLLSDLEEPVSRLKRLKAKLEWPLTKERVNTHLVRLERVKSWLILVLTSDNSALQRDVYRQITGLAESLEKDLKVRDDERAHAARRELFNWLAPVNPTGVHLRASKARESETGRWFLDGSFRSWINDSSVYRKILFLMGKSGIGKTTLFAHAVDELMSMSSSDQEFAFAYFYCTFGDTASQDPVNILGSFVVQLSEAIPSILETIWPLYEKATKLNAHTSPIDITSVEDAIIKHASGPRRVVLFVDAMNESAHMENIKCSLLRLSDLSPHIRILVTGTTDVFTAEHASIINMNGVIIRSDIHSFVRSGLQQDETLRNLSPKLKEQILAAIVEGADGSFRWAKLSLENLATCRTAKSIREALQTLPRTLQETYVQILERISPNDRELGRKVLFWLSFSKRPLTLRELNVAVVLDESCTVFDEDLVLIPPGILLQICQGLITEDEFGNLNLAHASIKDFLTSEWIRSSSVRFFSLDHETADKTIMRQCLTYLCLDNFQPGYFSSSDSIASRLGEYPLLDYASYFWASHCRSTDFDVHDRQLVNKLFESRTLPRRGNFGVWLQTLIPEASISNFETTQPLYYAASFGLVSVVKAILASDPDIDIDARGGRFQSTPLFVACWRGYYEVVELLLQAGANPHLRDGSGMTALSLIKTRRHPRLQAMMSVNRKSQMYGQLRSSISGLAHSEEPEFGRTQEDTAWSDTNTEVDSNSEDNEVDFADRQSMGMHFTAMESLTIPALEYFKAHMIQLYPRLESTLVSRFANAQVLRYERIVKLQKEHAQAVIDRSCPSGKYCFALGGTASLLRRSKEPSDSSWVTDFSNDRRYRSSAVGEVAAHATHLPFHIPIPPVSRLPARFECPICFRVVMCLRASDWIKHVYDDVEPFTCTFPDCSNPESYTRKAEWIRHEGEKHRKTEWWECSYADCSHKSFRRDLFREHLVREHNALERNTTITKTASVERLEFRKDDSRRIWDMIEQCRKENKKISPKQQLCPFCGEICRTWKILTTHMGKHLEQLVMPVLELAKQNSTLHGSSGAK
ncbi:hypothetical protein PVAR5_0174 [Paecilomyces variotii No. 5]|uniref:C2H2-type domain-containing protein n=1 Tax=Byssochlamys spectabilis (strain No. 5 / NBRC 109023) TaxID=1356009 RepID=V5FPT5_BYSSN|nr:hypothetical protein PVAR5_0174 [Paecilomyces variotii No. 5]